jgi:hypothetical protein
MTLEENRRVLLAYYKDPEAKQKISQDNFGNFKVEFPEDVALFEPLIDFFHL